MLGSRAALWSGVDARPQLRHVSGEESELRTCITELARLVTFPPKTGARILGLVALWAVRR